MSRPSPTPEAVASVIDAIPHGRRNAISRSMLAGAVHLSDRHVRACIEAARNDGVLIISDQDAGGYYIATEPAEIRAQYRIDRARALAILKRLKPMRQYLKERGEPL